MRTSIRTAGAIALAGLLATACTEGRAAQAPPRVDLTDKVSLVSYTSCDDMLNDIRRRTAENVSPWGVGPAMYAASEDASLAATATAKGAAPDQSYSTTNVHEAGVDEPDLVKTDGQRIITVSQGVLRVVDIESRRVTGTLRLVPKEQAWARADLLISGNRALVLFEGMGGMIPLGAMAKVRPGSSGSTYMLVDLSGAPKVLATMTADGTHVDARQVGSTVRLVVRSQPNITLPPPKPDMSESRLLERNRRAVLAAPVNAWLPSFQIVADGVTRTDAVKCEQISHPAEYTGTSMLTVHTIDLAADQTFSPDSPISVAADGDTVYGTATSLYVTSNPRWWARPMIIDDMPMPTPRVSDRPRKPAPTPTTPPERTEVHRFDITGAGSPRYVDSGSVPGRLLNQYSLSESKGNLRVATTSNSETFGGTRETSESGVYVLDATSLSSVGSVTGLGKGERIYSVRFIGDVGYVVTFKQTDPLYALDLRDPADPKVTGELKISGYSSYLHPGGEGRLLGIGQEATESGQTLGTQISLFDVSDPASPKIVSRFLQEKSASEAEWDPHAFVYWPQSGLAMLPLQSWAGDFVQGSSALVLKVGDGGIDKIGMINHPSENQGDGSFAPVDNGIRRCVVIGNTIWTVSDSGLKVSDATSLADRAWIPFA
ncbi:beta-propeller domain-containing protein [Planotetraspora phitsanulokensis]|uniref:Beta propeller domain-containing protein n=1 Tax=Planotetraspora phitsanulokensis TaxID=575192 RepID=A0A8J3U8G8_9ACTN|nr:beta-propeller domain-containing protein [Planotetraspora phitsanulokensis]GII40538.1 hypothetical protein Pph01_55410 [Planotetraspora phitsanulokensis]